MIKLSLHDLRACVGTHIVRWWNWSCSNYVAWVKALNYTLGPLCLRECFFKALFSGWLVWEWGCWLFDCLTSTCCQCLAGQSLRKVFSPGILTAGVYSCVGWKKVDNGLADIGCSQETAAPIHDRVKDSSKALLSATSSIRNQSTPISKSSKDQGPLVSHQPDPVGIKALQYEPLHSI